MILTSVLTKYIREVPPEIFDYLELDTVYKVDSPS
jgi:hypothetical protein